jgi:predicted regulator of Ras-like GTPase activity (Roadblock/LC7/MglB family)
MSEEFEEIVKNLSKVIESTVFIGIIGRDGLPVSVKTNESFDRSESSAEIAGIFNAIQEAISNLNMGSLIDFFIDTDKFGAFVSKINEDYFLGIIMHSPVNIGRCKLETRRITPKLRQMIEQ